MRFPRRDSRHTLRPPEDTSTGAVPLNAAKRSRVANRAMSPVMPTTVAANHRPDAEDADGRGARRDDDLLEAFLRLGHLPVDAAKVVEELGRQFDTSRRNGAVGLYLGQQRGRFLGVDLVGRRPRPARTAPRGADRRSGCDCSTGSADASPIASSPPHDPRHRPPSARMTAAPRWRPTRRHEDRSCWSTPWPAAAPAPPASAARQARVRRWRPAAERGGSRARRDPAAGTSFGSQAATATGGRFVSSAARISRQYEQAAPT